MDLHKLKIGLIFEKNNVFAWQTELVQKLQAENHEMYYFEVVSPKPSKSLLFSAYQFLDKKVFGFKCQPDALAKSNFEIIIKKNHPFPSLKRGESENKEKVDILLNLTNFPISEKSFFEKSKYGIWEIAFPENPVPSLAFAGFEEAYRDKDYLGIGIVAKTEKQNYLLNYAQCFNQILSPCLNQNMIFWQSVELFLEAIRKFSKSQNLSLDQFPIYQFLEQNTTFDNFKMLKMSILQVIKISKKIINTIRFVQDYWVLMINKEGKNKNFENWIYLMPPTDRFWADPFLIENEGKNYIFFEECFLGQKGHLSVMELYENGTHSEPEIILKKDYHLSYPFVFEYQNEWYMIPETAENQTVELYKAAEFPQKWVFVKNLLENIKACDATLLYHENKYWLFMTVIEAQHGDLWDKLSIFYADDLMGEWTSHPENPVVKDIKTARCAGKIFQKNGKWYRTAQNSSKRYGYGLAIREIITLNEQQYEEKTVENILPDCEKIEAVHTYNFTEKWTVIDGVYRKKK